MNSKNQLLSYISLTFEIIKRNILSAMEYRVSFFMQVFGMIVNDVGLVFVWVFFFQKFPQVNGWGFQDSILLFAIAANFGYVMVFGRGAFEMAKSVAKGELDYFLTLPKNVLWHITVSKTDISAIGDLLFGLAIFFLWEGASLEKFLLFNFLALFSALILLNFIIVTQSIAFFVGDFESAAENLFWGLLSFSLYPQNSFSGALKIVMMTILPAFFINTLPVKLIQNFSWKQAAFLFAFWSVTSFLALMIFKKGLKRYESGNLIGVKN